MVRYFSSFFVTTTFYILLLSSLLYSFNGTSKINQQNKTSEQKVKVTLIAKALPEPEPIEKKVIKEEKKKSIKKIVKKTLPKPIKKEEKPVKNALPQKTNNIPKTQIKKNKNLAKKPTFTTDTQTIQIKQKAYYSQIKEVLNQNKIYPKSALRRGIEGKVKVKFILSKEGTLLSYTILKGKSIFKNSVIQTIQTSFPLIPPNNIFTKNIDLDLILDYKLY